MQQGLRTLEDLVERTLSFLDSLVVLVPSRILLGQGAVDDFESVSQRFHLLLDLPLFLLLLVDKVLYFLLLLVDAVHHLD